MKKIIAFACMVCTLHNNSSCMLTRIVHHQKQIRPHIRLYHTRPYYEKRNVPQLPAKNLFNTQTDNVRRTLITPLVHDLFDRNGQFRGLSDEQENILGQQNDILSMWMSGHADKLDMQELSNLEGKLRKTFSKFSSGHANE